MAAKKSIYKWDGRSTKRYKRLLDEMFRQQYRGGFSRFFECLEEFDTRFVDLTNDRGFTVLHAVMYCRNSSTRHDYTDSFNAVLEKMVLQNFNFDQFLAEGSTLVMCAAKCGFDDFVEKLAPFSNVFLVSVEGKTALDYAKENGSKKCVTLLEELMLAEREARELDTFLKSLGR